MELPTTDEMDKSHCKPMISTINYEESFSENNLLPPVENKVICCMFTLVK